MKHWITYPFLMNEAGTIITFRLESLHELQVFILAQADDQFSVHAEMIATDPEQPTQKTHTGRYLYSAPAGQKYVFDQPTEESSCQG